MLDSNFSKVEQNQFKKIYRAKTPRRKENIFLSFSNLARFASLRESSFPDSVIQERISNMWGSPKQFKPFKAFETLQVSCTRDVSGAFYTL